LAGVAVQRALAQAAGADFGELPVGHVGQAGRHGTQAGEVRRFHKRPGQITVAVLAVVPAFLHAVALLIAKKFLKPTSDLPMSKIDLGCCSGALPGSRPCGRDPFVTLASHTRKSPGCESQNEMNAKQASRLNSYGATISVLQSEKYETLWSSKVAFSKAVTDLKNVVGQIDDCAQVQESLKGSVLTICS
jgi:hypothetical protein